MRHEDGAKSDARLIDAVATGDRGAFRTLFARYHGPVHGYALRIVGTADRAEEVASDTMVALWNGAGGFEGRAKVSTWIFGIAHRLALKRIRRRGVERGKVDLDEAGEIADGAKPADTALFHRQVGAALKALPVEMRAVVELTYYHGYSVSEVAEVTGLPPGTVKSRMHAARQRLKERLG